MASKGLTVACCMLGRTLSPPLSTLPPLGLCSALASFPKHLAPPFLHPEQVYCGEDCRASHARAHELVCSGGQQASEASYSRLLALRLAGPAICRSPPLLFFFSPLLLLFSSPSLAVSTERALTRGVLVPVCGCRMCGAAGEQGGGCSGASSECGRGRVASRFPLVPVPSCCR